MTMPATTELHRAVLPSPVGALTLIASDVGLRAVLWPDDRPTRVPLTDPVVDHADPAGHHHLEGAADAIRAYFSGVAPAPVALDPVGTRFQLAVWDALRALPWGATSTYGAIARTVGRPGAARAVGAAIGRNPISVLVPCHRVLGSDGRLTGFAGGLDTKRWLLGHEGVHLADDVRGRDRDVRCAPFEA